MKTIIHTTILLLALNASAKNFFDWRKPFERCGDLIEKEFGSDKNFLAQCAKIQAEQAADCVENVARTGSLQNGTIKACAYIDNDFSASAVDYYTKNYSPEFQVIVTMSFINTDSESDCVQRMLGSGSFSKNSLAACLQEPAAVQKDRYYAIVGLPPSTPKNFIKHIWDNLKSWWNGTK